MPSETWRSIFYSVCSGVKAEHKGDYRCGDVAAHMQDVKLINFNSVKGAEGWEQHLLDPSPDVALELQFFIDTPQTSNDHCFFISNKYRVIFSNKHTNE